MQKLVYLGVADGVGNWRKHNVDPGLYASTLVENAKKVAEKYGDASVGEKRARVALPIDVITEAWEKTNNINDPEGADTTPVIGSSTICVVAIDLVMNQLYYSNIGDSGLIVLRRIDPEVAGYMR